MNFTIHRELEEKYNVHVNLLKLFYIKLLLNNIFCLVQLDSIV